MNRRWVQAALEAVAHGRLAVLVTLVGIRGSSPRGLGAAMLVGRDGLEGSIGGGVLEHVAIQRSRRLIAEGSRRRPQLFAFPLGADSQQCCGGVVVLLLEPLAPPDRADLEYLARPADSDRVDLARVLGEDEGPRYLRVAGRSPNREPPAAVFRWWGSGEGSDAALVRDDERLYLCRREQSAPLRLALFGAGHVGRALVDALSPLDCRVDWFDSRPDAFPARTPGPVTARFSANPDTELDGLFPGTQVLVMTHRHPLDYAICRAALDREDLGQVGLIGSRSKRRRFVRRLIADGLPPARAEQLVCPIGVPGIGGKAPPIIAAATVAQLLQWHDAREPASRRIGLCEADVDASGIAAPW